MPKKYPVKLSKEQRQKLQDLTGRGTVKVRVYKRARVLLLADEGHREGRKTDEQIKVLVDISVPTIQRLRQQFNQEGLEAALNEKPRPGAPKKFSGRTKAEITALACSDPPAGYADWSLRLLADKLVELELVDSISHQKVRQILKKTT